LKYQLYVDDNYDYMEEDERYLAGKFDKLEEAIAIAKQIVDDYLLANFKAGMSAEELYSMYTEFGEDPFIVGGPPESTFSAWSYAMERCEEICR